MDEVAPMGPPLAVGGTRRSRRLALRASQTSGQTALDREKKAKDKGKWVTFQGNRGHDNVESPQNMLLDEGDEAGMTRCVCEATGEESLNEDEFMIQCENCKAWQHQLCMGLGTKESLQNDDYYCHECRPELHVDLLKEWFKFRRQSPVVANSHRNLATAPWRVSRTPSRTPSLTPSPLVSLKRRFSTIATEDTAAHHNAAATSGGTSDRSQAVDTVEELSPSHRNKRKRAEDQRNFVLPQRFLQLTQPCFSLAKKRTRPSQPTTSSPKTTARTPKMVTFTWQPRQYPYPHANAEIKVEPEDIMLDMSVENDADVVNTEEEDNQSDITMENTEEQLGETVQRLVSRLQALFRNVGEYKRLLACRGSSAQKLLDMLQRLLDMPRTPSRSFHRNLIVATQRLAGKSGLYPLCYELTDIATLGDYSESAGGFSDIYKGSFWGRTVCLKVIRLDKKTHVEHLLKVCSKEAILWGQLSHPNLLPFYGIYRFNHRISFVAPWMDHGDVNEYLKNHPAANRVLLICDVVQGLQFLHKSGIIHGDLKGSNILVKDSGRACLADFGISSISDRDILAWTTHSSVASKGGTVRWQAPELFDPEGDEDIHNTVTSDIYAWSCVVYEIFTGLVPFAHLSRDAAVMFKVSGGERPMRPLESSSSWNAWGLTEYVWTMMQNCWKTNPEERPTVDEIAERLAQVRPQDMRPAESDSALSPAQFREITRQGLNHDEMSVETLESLLDAS